MNFTGNSTGNETDFSEAENPITFLNKIKSDEITIGEAKELQEDFNNYLKMIRRGSKTEEQKKKKHCQILIDFLMEEMILINS